MKNYITTAKAYAASHKNELIEFAIGLAVVVVVIAVVGMIVTAIRNSGPNVVYQPANACDLLTLDEAKLVIGESALQSSQKDPVITGDTAASDCGYADGNPDKESMIIAAISVRSGINDEGVEQNKSEFVAGTPTKNVEIVNDLGDKAYFNQERGLLNVLSGRNWIIISNGVGSEPMANILEDTLKVAHQVLPTPTPITSKF